MLYVPAPSLFTSFLWDGGLSLNVKLTEHGNPPVSTLQSAGATGLQVAILDGLLQCWDLDPDASAFTRSSLIHGATALAAQIL